MRGKLAEVLKKLAGGATFFDGIHIFTPHADVPDDSALRLIFLSPEEFYAREETRMALESVLEYVRNNGAKPRYLYLPRLKKRGVLEQAIVKGAASRDFFGTAYGQHEGKFDGFKLGDTNVQLDDTLLLIKPDAAKQYEAAQTVLSGSTLGLGNSYSSATLGTPSAAIREMPAATPSTPDRAPKSHAFIGTAEVNAATAKMRLVQIAEEIISVLASDSQANVKVSVEITADFPEGVSDQVRRAVSENATSLGFKNKTWE